MKYLSLTSPQGFDACVFCGACCKSSHCGYGKPLDADQGSKGIDHNPRTCAYLIKTGDIEGLTLYSCSIAAEIAKQPGSEFMPAFGAGCCRTLFNQERESIVKKVKAGIAPNWENEPNLD